MTKLFVPAHSPEDLTPEIISMGTTRTLRIKRVGAVYFVENLTQRRGIDDAGKEVLEDQWKVVCVSKGKDARREAFKWMNDANVKVMEMILEDMATARASAHRA